MAEKVFKYNRYISFLIIEAAKELSQRVKKRLTIL